jgi:PAS domain S-box-containing protein
MDTAGWAVLLGAIGTALGAGGAFLLQWLQARHAINKQDRADALLEWREIAHDLGERLERHQQEIEAQKTEVARISQCHVQCQVENAELRGEIRLLQSAVRRLQGLADDEAPATVVPATLVAGLDGTILQASPAITPLLHWMAREVIGKNAETLLPERYRQALRDELAALAASGQVPWTEKVLLVHGLTKEGSEVPVSVALAAWQDRGKWLISAEIQRRRPTGNTQLVTGPAP